MMQWQEVFAGSPAFRELQSPEGVTASTLTGLRDFLDAVHIRHCLVKPFFELPDYPVVEPRELLPSFESDMCENKALPGFALVAFARPLEYFSEIFQYDKLHSVVSGHEDNFCPLESQVLGQNVQTLASRLPRMRQQPLRDKFCNRDVTLLDTYPDLLDFLLDMDRAQVVALDADKLFHLAGVFASFPSDIDTEIKRFGLRIGKFVYGDNELYERNRMFVYQYLMELYGFPIVSERRTSSALFARKLHRMGENFLLRVLGQSDRVLTTYIADGEHKRYPKLEKIALVAVDADQEEAVRAISSQGCFLDEQRRVAIMRVSYRQHRYDAANLRQDRALSVMSQEVLHPRTGQPLRGLNIIRDASNMFLRLNDIVRGEYSGRTVYKRMEIVENTDTDEKRLKFLYSWLTKHQRRMITYGDEYFANVEKVVAGYLKDQDRADVFESMRELYQEVCSRMSYILQARRVRVLQDIAARNYRGKKISYSVMCREAVEMLTELQFEIVNFFPELVDAAIGCVNHIIHDSYLQRKYVSPPESGLTRSGLEIRKNYRRLIAILDNIKAVRKARMLCENRQAAESGVA